VVTLRVFIFLSVCILPSCASGPVNDTAGPLSVVAVAATPEAVIPQWQPFGDIPGVDPDVPSALACFNGKTVNPRLTFYALRIDLAAPGLRIVVRGGAGGPEGTQSVKVSSFVRDNGLLAGINAVPFDPSSAREGEARTNVGMVISCGILISRPNPRFDALVWYSGSGPVIVPQAELPAVAAIENAVGGFHQILKDGELTPRALNSRPRYPRSAAGLSAGAVSAGARFLYLLVIDGGQSGSTGATEAETALILRALGASDGLNLDGGGSSALALRGPDGNVRVVNKPVHGGVRGRERAVAGCLGVGRIP
jgi:hypothetical protein